MQLVVFMQKWKLILQKLTQNLSEIKIQYPSKLITYWNRRGRFCCLDFTLVDIFNGGRVVCFSTGLS